MDALRFLLDEHMPEYLGDEIVRLEPSIRVVGFGHEFAPSHGIKDPELLVFCEENGLILLTHDKSTIPGHMEKHFANGRHTWGVLILRPKFPVDQLAEEVVLLWSLLERDDWRDYSLYLPMQ